ncbi:hypothetical protein RCG23_02190 [Neobacillus sp. PS3-34]|uniref:hypothetical protein n=1 Tax=Neobacillus sp. PS3-34 TaxID=3070678 RepID=UPI0027E00142|nr:hypothetical protein [Neobacillus sp. PS3-34]WML48945.1 hypothetical protein RCG23_02190 [Neobacillus sp. PS3-34]
MKKGWKITLFGGVATALVLSTSAFNSVSDVRANKAQASFQAHQVSYEGVGLPEEVVAAAKSKGLDPATHQPAHLLKGLMMLICNKQLHHNQFRQNKKSLRFH